MKLTKKQIQTLVITLAGLGVVALLIYFQQTNFFGRNALPQTEQQAKRSGKDTEQILQDMRAPTSINDIQFDFQKLEDTGVPDLQVSQLKELLFQQFPTINKYIIEGDISFDYKDETYYTFFNTKTSDNKIYSITISYQTYDLFVIIKEDDQIIYISPTS